MRMTQITTNVDWNNFKWIVLVGAYQIKTMYLRWEGVQGQIFNFFYFFIVESSTLMESLFSTDRRYLFVRSRYG